MAAVYLNTQCVPGELYWGTEGFCYLSLPSASLIGVNGQKEGKRQTTNFFLTKVVFGHEKVGGCHDLVCVYVRTPFFLFKCMEHSCIFMFAFYKLHQQKEQLTFSDAF
jgi:hypothetical protein